MKYLITFFVLFTNVLYSQIGDKSIMLDNYTEDYDIVVLDNNYSYNLPLHLGYDLVFSPVYTETGGVLYMFVSTTMCANRSIEITMKNGKTYNLLFTVAGKYAYVYIDKSPKVRSMYMPTNLIEIKGTLVLASGEITGIKVNYRCGSKNNIKYTIGKDAIGILNKSVEILKEAKETDYPGIRLKRS